MRVSDAERDAATAELREHFASGRLNQDELDERLAAAFAAKTRGDLNAVFADLPSSGRGWANAPAGGDGGQASGSIGPGAQDWGQWSGAGASSGYTDWRASAGRGIGRIAMASVLVWVLFILGILGVFGLGTGRPFGVVLIIAALAVLRRLLFMIFGRRRMRGGRGRGPRRRC
jgi:hypothetical protein